MSGGKEKAGSKAVGVGWPLFSGKVVCSELASKPVGDQEVVAVFHTSFQLSALRVGRLFLLSAFALGFVFPSRLPGSLESVASGLAWRIANETVFEGFAPHRISLSVRALRVGLSLPKIK